MRASRLLSILILLQLRTRLTADDLAREFEVSLRTIYRDIDELSAAGIPIYGDRGPGGGFQLLNDYRTKLTGLAAQEAEAMFLIGVPDAARALGLEAAASNVGRKMMASIPKPLGETAQRLNSRIHIDFVDWYRAPQDISNLPEIARAVMDQNAMEMQYESWTGKRDWRILPLGLVMKAGNWYLVGEGAKKIRIFKMSNISNLVISNEKFIRDENFILPDFWNNEIQRFEEGLRPYCATILANETGLKNLEKLGGYALNAVKSARPRAFPKKCEAVFGQETRQSKESRAPFRSNRNGTCSSAEVGWLEVQLPFENISQATLMILGLGADVKVLSPLELRDSIANVAKQILANDQQD